MLSDRRQKVLAALIEEYVARALPVGSRTLTERYQLGVSPATVRNELSVLEDGGYIASRIPLRAGSPPIKATAPSSMICFPRKAASKRTNVARKRPTSSGKALRSLMTWSSRPPKP